MLLFYFQKGVVFMATTRGWEIKGNILNCLNYILDIKNDEEKTEQGFFTSNSYGTKSSSIHGYKWKAEQDIKQSSVVGYHLQFSLPSGEGTPEDCLALAEEWIKTISNDKAKYVIAVHTNTNSIHAHIVCDYYLKDGKPWHIYFKKSKERFRAAADRICEKYGFSTLEQTKAKGQHYFEYMNDKIDTNRDVLKKVLDEAIPKVASYQDLKEYLSALGFKVYDNQNKVNENNFIFTADAESLKIQKQKDGSYMIRIPRQSNFIKVDEENFEWVNDYHKTAKVKIPIDKVVNVYSKEGDFLGDELANKLKSDFEDKTKDGRKGLRIKVPDAKRIIRTDRLDKNEKGEGYSLDEIIERISKNGKSFSDPTIINVINNKDDYKKNMEDRTRVYEKAGIKIDKTASNLYKSAKQERYFKWKSESVMKRMDRLNYEALMEKDRQNMSLLKQRRQTLRNDITDVNMDLEKVEIEIENLMKQRMEGVINISDDEIDRYIKENRDPLLQQRERLQNQIRLYSERINKAEESERKKHKNKDEVER